MSISICPTKINWLKFLESFPSPSSPEAYEEWIVETERELVLDEQPYNMSWTECYSAMQKHLPLNAKLSMEPLVQTVSSCPIRKPEVKFNKFIPPVKYNREDFDNGDGFEVFPAMSPGSIVDVLLYFQTMNRSSLMKNLSVAWDKSSKSRNEGIGLVESFDEYVAYLDNWVEIICEVRDGNYGFCISCLI